MIYGLKKKTNVSLLENGNWLVKHLDEEWSINSILIRRKALKLTEGGFCLKVIWYVQITKLSLERIFKSNIGHWFSLFIPFSVFLFPLPGISILTSPLSLKSPWLHFKYCVYSTYLHLQLSVLTVTFLQWTYCLDKVIYFQHRSMSAKGLADIDPIDFRNSNSKSMCTH